MQPGPQAQHWQHKQTSLHIAAEAHKDPEPRAQEPLAPTREEMLRAFRNYNV